MAYDKAYYDGKKQDINIKYVRTMEELVDEMAATLNKFFSYKAELNEQLREIAKREIEAGEGAETVSEQPAIPTEEEIEATEEEVVTEGEEVDESTKA